MVDYQKMYCILFNEISRVIEMLQKAQCDTENVYMATQEMSPSTGKIELEAIKK